MLVETVPQGLVHGQAIWTPVSSPEGELRREIPRRPRRFSGGGVSLHQYQSVSSESSGLSGSKKQLNLLSRRVWIQVHSLTSNTVLLDHCFNAFSSSINIQTHIHMYH